MERTKWLGKVREHYGRVREQYGHAVVENPAFPLTSNDTVPTLLPDPPPTRSPTHQRYLTVTTMMRNQRRWIREWIEFHLLVGVQHFIIYDNDSTDHPIEVLQHYIDEGLVTLIPWPPKTLPSRYPARTAIEQWQDTWFRDSLETCLDKSWTIHQQGPCQLAAFMDAIWRTKDGVSRWLGVWDVDEFIYPPTGSRYSTLSDTLKSEFHDYTAVRMWGSVFGTSGHVHAATRKDGSPLQALVTEEYIYRSELDHRGYNPFSQVDAEGWEVTGKGQLGHIRFGGGDDYARKSLGDPDMVSHSWIHHFDPPGNVGNAWREANIDVTSNLIKFNHYAFLGQEEARIKSERNKNPFMNFNADIDAFFSRERDVGIQYLLPRLKTQMLESIEKSHPLHPDDWSPPTSSPTPTPVTQSWW